MPSFAVTRTPLARADVEVVAVGATASPSLADDAGRDVGRPPPPTLSRGAEEVAAALGVDLAEELAGVRFDGTVGAVARVPTRGAIPARSVLVVGLGKAADRDRESFRRAGAAIADATAHAASLATDLPSEAGEVGEADAAQALVEGISLAAYRYLAHKTDADGHELETVHVVADGVEDAVARGEVHADAARSARDLVNDPPATKRPPLLADRIAGSFRGTGVAVEVLDEVALERGGYGGILAVGRGSDAPPRLVELTYAPESATRHVALVGKGITFDSGGLSLKTSEGMMTMKADMSGAAAVAATVRAAAALALPVRITGVLALAENMPSGSAQRPGDVYTARNGRTVEVLNTDAEGRLVLSDALAHASEKQPDAVVDLATLTGAVLVALGDRIAGLMTPDDGLAEELLAASGRSGERLWRLPLPDDYREDLDSDVADVKNIGQARKAGTIVAGLFLREFVGDGIPWAHLDIAGTAWSEKAYGYVRKGGTGAPVRTLLAWLGDQG